MNIAIIRMLDEAYPIVGGIFVGAMLFLAVKWIRLWIAHQLLERFPTKSLVFVAILMTSMAAIDSIVKGEARSEVRSYLDGLQTAEVSINGESYPEPSAVLDALRSMSGHMAHHSHPEMRLEIKIWSNRGTLTIRLGRDSDRPDEYWVFCPRYRVTNLDEIDRIYTHLFDRYQPPPA